MNIDPLSQAGRFFRKYAGGTLRDTSSRAFSPPAYFMVHYELESTAERRSRRDRDIKHLFYQLTIDENMSFMEAYEAVGYVFYLSADHVQKILRSMNKSRQNAERLLPR